jgi:hypothetical protein
MPKNLISSDPEIQCQWVALRLLFLDRIWRAMWLMAIVAVPASISRAFYTGWQPVFSVHVLLLFTVTSINLLGHRLSYSVRVLSALVMLDATAVMGLFNFGLLGSAWWWLFLSGLLAGHFYNKTVEAWHIGGSLLMMGIAASGFVGGSLSVPYNADEYIRQPASWLTLIAGPVFMSVLTFRALSIYQDEVRRLLGEVETARSKSDDLARLLERSLAEIKTLHGFIPICAHCKKVRDDKGYWESVEAYIAQHSDAKFTHLLCPPCGETLYGADWKAAMANLKPQ